MRKILTCLVVILLYSSMFTVFQQLAIADPGDEDVIFFDDFESYAVGTFPSAGGWTLVYNGMGNEYQKIVDTTSVSGVKSLQLWGRYMWSAAAFKAFSYTSKIVGYELNVKVEEYGTYWRNAEFGFWSSKTSPTTCYTRIGFNSDGKIYVDSYWLDGVGAGPIYDLNTTYNVGVWYKIRVVVDTEHDLFDVWINGSLKGEDLYTNGSFNIDTLVLGSSHAATKVYYDDVKVFNRETTNALVGYWKFDEGSGTIASDSSGNGNIGKLTNGPQWIDGVVGTALAFDGVDDHVHVPSSNSLTITGNQITVEMWLKPATLLDDDAPFINFIDKGNEYGFQISQDGKIWFYIGLDLSGWHWEGIQTTTNQWIANKWYHLAGTYDGNSLKIYVNGILENSRLLSGNLFAQGAYPLSIGSYTLGNQYFFNGAIDEVKIYNYARTPEEIWNDYISIEQKTKILGMEFYTPGWWESPFSFPNGTTFTLKSFLEKHGFDVDISSEVFSGTITLDGLLAYDAVILPQVFFDVPGNVAYESLFEQYANQGGGLIFLGQAAVPEWTLDEQLGFHFVTIQSWSYYVDARITDPAHPIMSGITELPKAGGVFVDWDTLIAESPLPTNTAILARSVGSGGTYDPDNVIALIAFQHGLGRVVAGPLDGMIRPYGPTTVDGWDVVSEPVIENKLLINAIKWVARSAYPTFEISISSTSGGITNPPAGVYALPFGSRCPITATPDANYVFDHWELDGVNIGSSNPVTVTMDKDHSLHAVFTLISPPTYAVTIKAHCNTEGTDVTVRFWIDGSPTTYYTPYTFPSLTGTHTFTISTSDASGHQFKQWSTGATSHTITVSAGGTYTAYYEASPPTRYDVTINGYCITEATNINVEIIKDGVPTGFTTPHTFYGLTGTHTFTVPNADARKHKFKNWNTGHMSTTITVNSGATLTAYYEDQGNVIAGGIEAVQTIFDADLVQNKPTTFFITYKSTFVEEKKAYVRIELEGFDYAEWTFPVTFKPGQHDFWLHNEDLKAPDIKPTTTSTARCKVTLDVFNEITETREDDNIWPPSGTENYKVWDTKGLKVLFVKLHHVDEPIDKRITNVQLYRYMIEVKDFFLATYPVAPYEVTFEQSYEALLVEKGKNWAWVLTKLIANYGYGYDKVVGVASDWPGWNDPSRDLFDGGVGVSGSGNTKSVMVQNKYACSVAHEIGHTYNLGDDYFGGYAGDGAFECRHWSGYWVTKRKPIIDAPTFMHDVPPFDSKGNPLPSYYYWIDNTDYALLLKKFCVSDPTVIIIGGIISRNGTIDPDNQFFRISIGQVDLENSTGDYYIVLLDESGQVLSKNGFNVTFLCLSDPPIEVNESSFCYAVRWLDGTRIIQIQDAEGNILASKDISQNPPTVNVVSPNGNEVFTPGKNHTIEWFASDPDGDSLTYDIFISGSLDSTPVPIAIGLNQTSFTYDFADLPAGDQYLIYVFACDGVNVAYDVSDGFFSVSGFKIDVLTAPQTIANGAKAYYWLNLTSYEGFHGEVTLNVSTISGNLKFRWILGPVIIIPRNGSAIAIVEVEAVNSEGGNHTITITGISDNCKAEKTTHIYILSNDISLCNIVLSKHITEQGYILTINVTVSNQGSLGQNFNLSLYCNSTEIAYESVFLHAGSLATITFTWNTTNFVEGNYVVWAYAWPVQGETDTEDNAYMDGTVRILQTLSVSITPSTTEIKVGESITFTSTVSGGLQPYSYWWFVNGTAVEGAISKSWTFMPTKPGTYIIHLNVTDSTPQTVKSNIAIVTVAPQLVASISPTSASILVGQSVTFTSTVSGGYTPYTYQWYLNGNPVSGATSATWTFTPTSSGIYYVYLKVTDDEGNIKQSETARIQVATVPVGGYSIPTPTQTYREVAPITPYLIITAIITITFTTIKRKAKRK